MSRLLQSLGLLCARRPYVVVAAWVLVLASIGAGVLLFGRQTTNDITLPGTDFQASADMLREEFPPQQNGLSPVVFRVANGTVTRGEAKAAIRASLQRMKRTQHVESVISPYSRLGKDLISDDETIAVAQVLLDLDGGAVTRELAAEVMAGAAPARAAAVQVEAGGVLGIRLSEVTSRRSEIIGIGVGIVILALTFGTLVAAGMPIVTALVGLASGLGLIGLLGHVVDIPVVAPTLATMLGLGVGIDYALFIVFRFRDELHDGVVARQAVARAMATSGSAVVFAGITVIIALLALLVANVPMLGAMGYASALMVFIAVLAAITLLPAMLALLGPRIDALRLPGWRRVFSAPERENVWARWAGLVTRHPWVALTGALLVLVPLAAPTLTLRLGQEDMGVASPDTTVRRSFDLIAKGLGPGANGRLLIAVAFDPAAKPSAAYRKERVEANRLKDRLERDAKRLKKGGAALKNRGADLRSEEAGLKARAAGLQARKATLEARGAALQAGGARLLAEKARLTKEKARLTAEQARLTAEGRALAAEGQALATQIAGLQQQIAASQDPAEIAALQAQLAIAMARAQEVQTETIALQKEGDKLARQGERLAAQARTLQARSASLQARSAALRAEGAALQGEGGWLAAAGESLQRRAGGLKRDAARLERRKTRLELDAEKARDLKAGLVKMLTKAGGQARATDPRLVALQDAFEHAPGVDSLTPPLVNESGSAAVLTLMATTRPADAATSSLVARLRDEVVPAAVRGSGMTAYVGGVTAAYDDLAALIAQRLPLVIAVVLGLSFIVLLVAFRSLLVPLKAILCNLLAVGAAFGILTVVFQWGWGLGLVGISSPYGTVPIASYVPLLMFAVLFGMSTDYEVFLISQIFRYHEAGQDSSQAVRSGVGTSARVISAAALIMVVVFASFIQHPDPVIKQFGVGLSVAILLDATIVRLVIVPATMVLLGEWNWYLPHWLWWLSRLDLPRRGVSGSSSAV